MPRAPRVHDVLHVCLNWCSGAEGVQVRVQGKEAAVAPLTSFDWACHDVSQVITCSIDTTCCLWDVEVRSATRPCSAASSQALGKRAHMPTATVRQPQRYPPAASCGSCLLIRLDKQAQCEQCDVSLCWCAERAAQRQGARAQAARLRRLVGRPRRLCVVLRRRHCPHPRPAVRLWRWLARSAITQSFLWMLRTAWSTFCAFGPVRKAGGVYTAGRKAGG